MAKRKAKITKKLNDRQAGYNGENPAAGSTPAGAVTKPGSENARKVH